MLVCAPLAAVGSSYDAPCCAACDGNTYSASLLLQSKLIQLTGGEPSIDALSLSSDPSTDAMEELDTLGAILDEGSLSTEGVIGPEGVQWTCVTMMYVGVMTLLVFRYCGSSLREKD